VGVKIDKKVVAIGERQLTLMLWDVAGEEDGKTIKSSFLRGASALILVADGCRLRSLDAALEMRSRFQDICEETVLAVNKRDLHSQWEVSAERLMDLDAAGLTTFTTSAKLGTGVQEMFGLLAARILNAADDENE
jgi:GTPase SAR1 family protein